MFHRTILLAAILALAGCQTPPQRPAPPTPATAAQPVQPTQPAAAQAVPTTPAKAAPAPVPAPQSQTPVPIMDWLKPAEWGDLPGWQDDDLQAAWPALLQSCRALQRQAAWQAACVAAGKLAEPDTATIRSFLQQWFKPYQVQQPDGSVDGLI